MKVEHTEYVCNEAVTIGKSLGLCKEDLYLAESMALFHDVGRFEQFSRYGAFSDHKSENHALLGADIIRRNAVLRDLDNYTQELILKIVTYHNRMELPDYESDRCLLFLKIIRDADKLDIYRVIQQYYFQTMENSLYKEVKVDFPDVPGISTKVYSDLIQNKKIKFSDLKTLNDLKLFHAGWIYDINYQKTFQLIHEREYLEMLFSSLPFSGKTKKLHKVLMDFLHVKMKPKFNS